MLAETFLQRNEKGTHFSEVVRTGDTWHFGSKIWVRTGNERHMLGKQRVPTYQLVCSRFGMLILLLCIEIKSCPSECTLWNQYCRELRFVLEI
jgi:hypothetical protein